jgi:pimeloyl-ACP methyl ester carboxylesterase
MHTIPLPPPDGSQGAAASHLAVRYLPAPDAGAARGAGAPAPCLLYLHGFGSHQDGEKADFFRRQAQGCGLAFCSFDFEGHGRSGGGMRGLTLSRNLANVDAVAAWLAAAGETRLCLIGSSMGGATALWFSALHPDRVAAGLHIAPALELERLLLAWAGVERARQWQETGTLRYSNAGVTCDLDWTLVEDLRAHRLDDLLASYRTPALLLQGRLDTSVPWRGVVDFVARCPYREIDLHLFADGDHRLTDRLDRLWSLMAEFLRGRGLAAF